MEPQVLPTEPGTPLMQATPERVNQGRPQDADIITGSPLGRAVNGWVGGRAARDSSVHEKVAQFNSLAIQSKALERKTHDAALKRAMLGREEAESEMRRFKEDAWLLRQQVEEGQDRERRVGERLEEVMERYARTKETFNNTKAVWEKEIRKARKEAFKSQSLTVQAQEETKAARDALHRLQSIYNEAKQQSEERDRLAFDAKYQLAEVQEKLAEALQTVNRLEHERDALKTIAKNEEIARIAAEGRIPLPPSTDDDDEFASPKKSSFRVSLPPPPSSLAAQPQIDDLRRELLWERHRADRAHEQVDFLLAQCELRCCPCKAVAVHATSLVLGQTRPVEEHNMDDRTTMEFEMANDEKPNIASTANAPAESLLGTAVAAETSDESADEAEIEQRGRPRESFSRTPSCEPPSAAMVRKSRSNTSLQSLLDAPMMATPLAPIPTAPAAMSTFPHHDDGEAVMSPRPRPASPLTAYHTISTTTTIPLAQPAADGPSLGRPLSSIFSPTMTREEALAQIAERRGRARSLAQGTMTPRKQMVQGVARRDISAPSATTSSSVKDTPARGRSRGRSRQRA